jgi:glutamate dehydrogenase (NAD(P)+)
MCAFEKLSWDPKNVTVAVQGFGNVGTWASKLLAEKGCKIVAISDISGGYYNADGIDIEEAIAYRTESDNSLEGFPGATKITNPELLELDVDLLCPCAMEDQITDQNADNIKAKLIVEGANGPVSANADAILDTKGVTIIPDILANAGGVTVSYFEWVQNRRGHYYTEKEVNEKADPKLQAAFEEVWNTAKQHDCSLRLAAYVVGIQRVSAGIEVKGFY